jgi:hypothetical protein
LKVERKTQESQREAKPLLKNLLPLSFEGEGDKGGEVNNTSTLREAIRMGLVGGKPGSEND